MNVSDKISLQQKVWLDVDEIYELLMTSLNIIKFLKHDENAAMETTEYKKGKNQEENPPQA
jgi:hypothetical protein